MQGRERWSGKVQGHVFSFYEQHRKWLGGSPTDSVLALEKQKVRLRKALADLPLGACILDVGCGGGEFLPFLKTGT